MKHSENLLLTASGDVTQPPNSVREYSDPIPVDLLIDIFTRVPLKSIARFHCVSKSWASILRHPDFTEFFLTKSLTRPRLFFTVEPAGNVDIDKLFFYSTPQPHDPEDNSSLVATPYHTSFPEYVQTNICTPICGLFLLRGWSRNKVSVICNLATREFLTLPRVKVRSNTEKIQEMYLGYDPVNKQFKVLCMTTSSSYERLNTHQVLTLEPGKKRVWRTIEYKFHFMEKDRIRTRETCINGVLYFPAKVRGLATIVCFDVRLEKFSFISIDKYMSPERFDFLAGGVFNYQGKLGLYLTYQDRRLVLSVLEDAGSQKWSDHTYEWPPFLNYEERLSLAGMTGTSEIVFAPLNVSHPYYIYFYNLESKTFTRVYIEGFEEFEEGAYVYIFPHYVETMKFM